MKEGTLRWNKAFEAIGFKDAIEVRDFPTDDPNFDPDNLKVQLYPLRAHRYGERYGSQLG